MDSANENEHGYLLFTNRRMEIQRLHKDIDYLKWTTTMTLVMVFTYILSGVVLDAMLKTSS
tara:strand:+ start:435 stop:617 length:183 start_codon:yes stop_codon:yes gene_type:complete